MQCVILAGGRGTRMQGIAKGLPKSLIPIGEHPFLHYQLRALGRQGVTNIVLCVGYGADPIKRYAKDGAPWGVSIRYVDEGDALRGTGGALRLAYEQECLEPRFLVTYGDSYLPIDFSRVWTYFQSRKEPALMVVLKNEDRWDKSNASFDGETVTRYDKKKADPGMRYVDYGLSALCASTVKNEIPSEGAFDLADLFHSLSERGELAGFEVTKRFYEIGSPQGLKDFSEHLKTSTL